MGHYDVALICYNGHVINARSRSAPQDNTEFCEHCGEKCISQCPACQASIRGEYIGGGVIVVSKFPIPKYCHNCGKPYPWTERREEALKELLQELEGLSPEERSKLEKSIPDILAETPRTQAAVVRFKKLITRLGAEASKQLVDLLGKVATDAALKGLGLQ